MGSVAIPSGGGGRVGDWTSQSYTLNSSTGKTKNITCKIGDLILCSSAYLPSANRFNLSSYSGINIIDGGVGKETTLAQATSENVTLTFSGGHSQYNPWGYVLVFHLNNHSRYDFNIVRAYGSSGSGSPQQFSDLKLGDVLVSLVGSTGGFTDMGSNNCGKIAVNGNSKVYMAFKDTASIEFQSDYTTRIFATCRPK